MIRTSTITLRIEDDDSIWEKDIDYHVLISMDSPLARLIKMHDKGQELIDFHNEDIFKSKDKS